mmetsp:Transcript_3639/g.6930  ORF Transcript_3639/g.6930 Transcript_3639/m.6930 type:complete len:202 (+) Transcript_3639:37-642(+)
MSWTSAWQRAPTASSLPGLLGRSAPTRRTSQCGPARCRHHPPLVAKTAWVRCKRRGPAEGPRATIVCSDPGMSGPVAASAAALVDTHACDMSTVKLIMVVTPAMTCCWKLKSVVAQRVTAKTAKLVSGTCGAPATRCSRSASGTAKSFGSLLAAARPATGHCRKPSDAPKTRKRIASSGTGKVGAFATRHATAARDFESAT